MATFKLSTFGRMYVTDEGLDELPLIRRAMVLITAVLGLVILLKLLIFQFWTLSSSTKSSSRRLPKNSNIKSNSNNKNLSTSLFVLHFISYAIHTIHYVDNIYRPVDYLEPKWLYVKYILSEMEITFFANFPISIIGYFTIVKLLKALNSSNSLNVCKYCKHFTFYIIGSLLTLGHYRTEPPTKYSTFVNFTIAGEGIVTILLSIVVWMAWRKFKPNNVNLDNEVESNDEEIDNLLTTEQDEEQAEQRNKSSSGKMRRRSKTPGGSIN